MPTMAILQTRLIYSTQISCLLCISHCLSMCLMPEWLSVIAGDPLWRIFRLLDSGLGHLHLSYSHPEPALYLYFYPSHCKLKYGVLLVHKYCSEWPSQRPLLRERQRHAFPPLNKDVVVNQLLWARGLVQQRGPLLEKLPFLELG